MESITELWMEALVSFLGLALTALTAAIAGAIKKRLTESGKEEECRAIVRDCVQAVEWMYREAGGEEKLTLATELAEDFLNQRRIPVEAKRLRILLESAVCELKQWGAGSA